MNGLSLFTGIGGLDVALSDYVRPIAYCEIDPYCQAVLINRQFDGLLPRAPIWDDITTLQVRGNGRNIHIIYGGFPCQDISVAGLGKGLAGKRSRLFFEILRLAKEIQPKFIFLENVPGITTRGGLDVVREVASLGYDCRWCVISAASVGAPHKRERWFLLAYSRRKRFNAGPDKEIRSEIKESKRQNSNKLCWGKTESTMDRKANGIPYQMDRIRALGNSVVPQQAKKAFEMLMGIKD
jgi:DNA (cytosine-5)-methyltransferase 1